jgi:SAM-dependent methyltransferase
VCHTGGVLVAGGSIGTELSDWIVQHDPDTLTRRPVRHAQVRSVFESESNGWALRILDRLPRDGPYLSSHGVDDVLIRAHAELQRLHLEFQHTTRMLRLLVPLVRACRAVGHRAPIHVVDIGCGPGAMVRRLARTEALGTGVHWTGCDFNSAFVKTATELARQEGVRCRFRVANALKLDEPATILLSTGVVHHFRGEALDQFFRAQGHPQLLASVHYDITPNWAAPIGAVLFHFARMRVPLARHDGIHSALRAHSDRTLAEAARGSGRVVAFFQRPSPWFPVVRVLRPVVVLRPDLLAPLQAALGPLAVDLDVLQEEG